MNKHFLRSLALLCLTLIISSFFVICSSAEEPSDAPIPENCIAACLFDKTHNKVLVMQNPDTPINTSTSAKVMMGLVACEMLSDRLDETVTVTDSMLHGSSGYSMKLKSGERLKIIDILYGAICGSYNDAGLVLASVCAGSTEGFVNLMNEKAKMLGAESTSYTNPLGYPDSNMMLTTLSDTLKIATAASDNSLYMEICSAKRYEIPATNMTRSRTVHNKNYLVSSRSTEEYYNPACSGMNAGISGDAGGWSIITVAHDEGADYICIILGGKESEDGSEIYAYDTANKLINWAIDKFEVRKIFDKGEILGQAEVEMTALGSKKVNIATLDELSIYISKDSESDLSYKLSYLSDRLTAPLKAGEKIGTVSVFSNGELVGEGDIALTEDCEVNAFINVVNIIGNYTKSRAFIASIVCFAILLPTVLVIKSRKSRKHGGYSRRY